MYIHEIISEGFSPSTFIKIGKYLIELQDRWVHKDDVKFHAWEVFCDGRKIGQILQKADGGEFITPDENFESLDDAIGFLIQNNARPASSTFPIGDETPF